MKLCRFRVSEAAPRVGVLLHESQVLDLSAAGIERLQPLLDNRDVVTLLAALSKQNLPRHRLEQVRLLPPVERQEIWAAGVTYLRSKAARMEESEFSANAYDRVYAAERPELFFKSLPEKAAGPGDWIGIRGDGRWNVPEPELALVLNSKGQIVGYTIGNDMSSRDIEGENLLYLPQAKVYDHSCALGPCLRVGASEAEARQWKIHLRIYRQDVAAFEGETSVTNIKRPFAELAEFLFRSQSFPHGAILLTGTGIVPPDDFSLQPKDRVEIQISGIGTLENVVAEA